MKRLAYMYMSCSSRSFLEGEKLARAKKDLEEQLMYMKRLAYTYVQISNKLEPHDAEKFLKIDPMYTAFQSKVVISMEAMMNYVSTVSHGLATKHYTAVLTNRDFSRRLLASAQ